MTTNNHPAHGPVSLDRLHQISEILSKASAQSDGGNLGYAMADAVKVIDGAIAAFDAEPVLYAAEETLAYAKMGELHLKCLSQPMGDAVIPLYTTPPAPIVPPAQNWEELCRQHPGMSIGDAIIRAAGWNLCRYTMIQGKSEPANQNDEFPLDYLQGQKDGLEWAAQLAEANHPQTGDWLYDDPIELARAIRKGPDMPEFKSVSVDEDDNFYSWFGRFWYENYQKNNYTTSAKQMLGTMAEFAYRAGRESAALASNSPVTPDGWVACSERMPEGMTDVHISNGHDVGQGWWDGDTWQTQHDYYSVPGDVTHWLSLPAAPQQEDL